ncbi:WD40-repeat-containing domain protein [Mycena pura]|uniref:WD40-repeat-containing domain protein n=1 Tax=Mycena pura TaxID=153505 RepID=A0AAD6YU01_9AGAR|nr:WD40-repeat-containing domain protein [Mycena pura]
MSNALVPAPGFSAAGAPVKSVSLSSSEEAYVLSIASLPSSYAAAASAPSNSIHLFDKSTLQRTHVLLGHDTGTTSLRAVDTIAAVARPCLVSSGLDGSIKIWDERTNTHSIKITNPGQTAHLLCCDVTEDGLTVAGGTQLEGEDAHIIYWDPRQPTAPLRTHSSTHSDDVTVLRFAPGAPGPNLILSASTDGLISTSAADEDDEDEAVIHVGAWNCSVSQAGWTAGEGSAKIWGHSDMETFSTWSDELDLLQSQDIREPSLHTHAQHEWNTDYLITCHSSAVSPALKVFVGSNQGDFALLKNGDLSVPLASWSLCNTWTNGHTGIVRSLLWDEQNSLIVTGGEDSKINIWNAPHTLSDTDDTAMDVDSPPPSRKRDLDWEDEYVWQQPPLYHQ